MSTITDKKITNGQRDAVWVQHQPNRLTGTPKQNQAVFDEYAELIREHFNEAMDAIDERISTNDSDIEQLKETDAGAAATAARESAESASESAQTTSELLGRVISISNKRYVKDWDITDEQDEFEFTATDYTYNESDTYEVFVNGLKLENSEFTQDENVVTLNDSISGAGNTVEIIVTTNLKGKGIADTELNDDYTLTINYDDGTSMTTESIRGEKGEKGDKGDGVYDDTQVKNDIAVLDSRVDSFTHLTEGSTTGDAELIDARIGADGTTYPNAGDSIREQVSSVKNATNGISCLDSYRAVYGWENGGTGSSGDFDANNRIRTGYIPATLGKKFSFSVASGYSYCLVYYLSDKTYARIDGSYRQDPFIFTPYYDGYIRIMLKKVSDANLSPADASNLSVIVTEPIMSEIELLKNGGYWYVDYSTTDGGYINQTNGNVVSYAGWRYTDYIDVSDSKNGKVLIKTYKQDGAETTDGSLYNAWYDASKTYLGALTITNNEIEIPSGAKYMRLSTRSYYARTVKTYKYGVDRIGIAEDSDKYLKVMTWNVGIFNNGITKPTAEEAPEKIGLLNRAIGKMDADVLNTQEYATYVDSSSQYPSANLLDYKYGNKYGGNAAFGFAKSAISNAEQIVFASGSGRPCYMYDIEFNGKTITIINCHLSIEVDHTVHRDADIAELISIMDTKDYVILTGDTNIYNDSEVEPFKTAGYTLCNGGNFGWFDTWPVNIEGSLWGTKHLDHIICSSNIVPQYVEAVTSTLSDHAPLYAEFKVVES